MSGITYNNANATEIPDVQVVRCRMNRRDGQKQYPSDDTDDEDTCSRDTAKNKTFNIGQAA